MLHLRDPEDGPRALRLLRMTQTSSPNYVLMMSVDDARAYMEAQGRERLTAVCAAADALRAQLPALGYGDGQAAWGDTGLEFDPTRLVIRARPGWRGPGPGAGPAGHGCGDARYPPGGVRS